jgi:hypothetical protein
MGDIRGISIKTSSARHQAELGSIVLRMNGTPKLSPSKLNTRGKRADV